MINSKIHWLPSILTMSNLLLGMLSLLFAVQGKYHVAALLIIFAALMDRADGKVARMFNVTSEFGKELDSLCDIVSFGVAPAVLVWGLSLSQLGNIGYLLAVLFPISGAYRLARFNVSELDGVFQGIPITVAGGLLSLSVLANPKYEYHIIFYSLTVIILSFLMVSNIKIQKI